MALVPYLDIYLFVHAVYLARRDEILIPGINLVPIFIARDDAY